MECYYREIELPPPLDQYLDCFWWENYCDENQNFKSHYVVPDNSIELIFTDSLFHRKLTNQAREWNLKSHIAGLKTTPQVCTVFASPLLSLRFKPKGLYLFSKIEMKHTIDACFSPVECFGNEMKAIENELFHMTSQEDRIELLTNFFNKKLHQEQDNIDVVFEEIVDSIEASIGMISVNVLCEQFALSHKSIERKFIKNLGITPKRYCRLVRTVNCLREGSQVNNLDLTDLAYRFAYFDQSHFIKDVRSITNHSPRDFYQKNKGIQSLTFG